MMYNTYIECSTLFIVFFFFIFRVSRVRLSVDAPSSFVDGFRCRLAMPSTFGLWQITHKTEIDRHGHHTHTQHKQAVPKTHQPNAIAFVCTTMFISFSFFLFTSSFGRWFRRWKRGIEKIKTQKHFGVHIFGMAWRPGNSSQRTTAKKKRNYATKKKSMTAWSSLAEKCFIGKWHKCCRPVKPF